jgi:nitrate reductase cytochrome c-type subunit
MLNKIALLILFSVSPLLWALSDSTKVHAFVGAEFCGMCHKSEKHGKQLEIWKASQHSQAYQALLTDSANKIAKDKGFSTPAAKTEACLKCHTSGSNVDASLLGAKFKIEDGVQCETCHGAGADYKAITIMKDKNLAVANGLQLHDDLNTFCVKCHNSESPTYKGAPDITAMWDKIKHPIPAETK